MVESIKKLRKMCYGKDVYRPWFNKYISKISIYVTWILLHTPITANQVTILEYFLLFLGAMFLSFGGLEYIFVGLLIIHFTNILDVVDGDIARYRKKSSLLGIHLENIYHTLMPYLMFFPLAFGIFLQTGWKSILILGFTASVFTNSITIPNMFEAIVKNRLHNKESIKSTKQDKINLQGSETGKKLSDSYDKFRDFWAAPTNLIQLTLIAIIELINQSYQFMPAYILFYAYFLIYSVMVVSIQIISFVVHYKGNAVEQYYKALFRSK